MDAGDARGVLDIAVGVLAGADGRLLIARRRVDTPGAGYWEFPGGKREPGEAMADCLARELAEEIGVTGCRGTPLIRFAHDRGSRPVRLYVYRIDAWRGEPCSLEGQSLTWVTPVQLADYALLPASEVILNALFLPACYAITPALSAGDEAHWFAALDALLIGGIRLLRLRDPARDDVAYAGLAREVIDRVNAHGARVMLDRDAAMAAALGAHGLHWSADRVRCEGRPALEAGQRFAVSAHGSADLAAAAAAGADFAVLSPVRATPSHPQSEALGWSAWAAVRGDHALAVYGLGGLGEDDLADARGANAQGVAAIRGFWTA